MCTSLIRHNKTNHNLSIVAEKLDKLEGGTYCTSPGLEKQHNSVYTDGADSTFADPAATSELFKEDQEGRICSEDSSGTLVVTCGEEGVALSKEHCGEELTSSPQPAMSGAASAEGEGKVSGILRISRCLTSSL